MKYSNLLLISISFIIISSFSCNANKKIKLLNSTTHSEDVKAFQDKINKDYKSDESPLREEDKADFTGLDFFPIDNKYQVLANFVRTPEEKPFAMKTSTDRTPIYIKYGEATFQLQGDTITLSLYRNPKLSRIEAYKYYLFLPFTDLTNGNTSYGGGRYIDLLIPRGNKIIIDFNKAYNPYCCYNDKFSCPIPPKENFMDLEIQAGVRTISD